MDELEAAINAKTSHLQGNNANDDSDDGGIEGLNDNYDGVDMSGQGKSKEIDQGPKILGDDFLADLKANDVVDSDDDCYF